LSLLRRKGTQSKATSSLHFCYFMLD